MATQYSIDTGETLKVLSFTTSNTPDWPYVKPARSHMWHKREMNSPFGPTSYGPRQLRYTQTSNSLWVSLEQGFFKAPANGTTPEQRKYFRSRGELYHTTVRRLDRKLRNIKLNLGVTLGELNQTTALLAEIIGRILRAYRYARKGRVIPALNALAGRKPGDPIRNTLSDNWLAYQFGLTPLLNDAKAAIEGLHGTLLKGEPAFSVYTSISEPLQGTVSTTNPIDGWTSTCTLRGSSKCYAKARVKIRDWNMYALEQLGLTNIPATLWELTPFSFVADWFAPIGSYLRGLQPPLGVDFQWGWIYYKAIGSLTYTDDREDPAWHTRLTEQAVYKRRYALSDFPEVKPVIPTIDLSVGQVTSALALLNNLVLNGGPVPRYAR